MTSTQVTVPHYQFKELQEMAKAIADSKLFGMKEPNQALALMLTAQAEGVHPATITQDYDIISGRATRKTNSVLARFQQAGGKVEWHELTDRRAEATFSHPAGGALRLEWTIEMANRIEQEKWDDSPDAPRGKKVKFRLTEKDNWKNYPRAMLRARLIAEGVRAVYPAAIGGYLVPEEAVDLDDEPVVVGSSSAVEQPRQRDDPAAATEKTGETVSATPPPTDDTTTTKAEPKPGADKPLQPGPARILNARIKSAGLTVDDLEKHLGKKFADLTMADFEPAQKWLISKAE